MPSSNLFNLKAPLYDTIYPSALTRERPFIITEPADDPEPPKRPLEDSPSPQPRTATTS